MVGYMYFLCDYIKLITLTFKKKNSDRNLVIPNEYTIFIHSFDLLGGLVIQSWNCSRRD